MNICERALNWFQIYDVDGSVRICSWTKDGTIGKLTENSIKELYGNEKARAIRQRHICNDYSQCMVDACPYLAMDSVDAHSVEYVEQEYPKELYLGFEQVCNYACRCCTIHNTMLSNVQKDLNENYDKIVKEIKKVLPYVRKISANGCGELFVSKRTLDILQNWRPNYPDEEVEVLLETNGSLFDEKHWKEIENLGKYNLHVAISVMSFDEEIYQFLSGTKLPIAQVENNLRFVKSLREKNIINHLEIATVVQEQNFRGIPEFARRCVEEFGADYVRLRPYQSWGAETPEVAWFTDIRNPEHPYYEEYKRVMAHPYLKHPKVFDWSGGLDTVEPVRFPYKDNYYKEKIIRDIVLNFEETLCNQTNLSEGSRVFVYGLADIGKVMVKELLNHSVSVNGIIDRKPPSNIFLDVPVFGIEGVCKIKKDDVVIVSPIIHDTEIFQLLKEQGVERIISVKEFILDEGLRQELEAL